MIEVTVSLNESNQRLDRVLQKILRDAPKPFIYRMLRKKNITLNGYKAIGNEKTVCGDVIRFYFSDETFRKLRGNSDVIEKMEIGFPEIPVFTKTTTSVSSLSPRAFFRRRRRNGISR